MTYKIILYLHNQHKDGTYPVVARVTHNRKSFRITLPFRCNEKEWNIDGCCFRKNLVGYKSKNIELRIIQTKIDSIFHDFKHKGKAFTRRSFLKELYGIGNDANYFSFVDTIIKELHQQKKFSTASNYRAASNRLLEMLKGNKNLSFTDIDYALLTSLENFLFARGLAASGVRDYLRYIRTIFNKAINRELVEEKYYPFSTQRNTRGFSLKHLKHSLLSRALSVEDMNKLKKFPAKDYPKLSLYWRMFMFCYYSRGMNFKDMILLKDSDVYNNQINYTRAKTQKPTTVTINKELKEIKEHLKKDNKYLLPVIMSDPKGRSLENKISTERTKYNRGLKKIATILGIELNLTSYVARHTYANMLRINNVNIDKISQALDHSETGTTKHYLKSFPDSEIDDLNELL